MYITVTGGTVASYAGDDAINVGISSENNKGNTYAGKGKVAIKGGTVYACSTSNDAIDANGTISISGGVVVACGDLPPEDGFDCDQNSFAHISRYLGSLLSLISLAAKAPSATRQSSSVSRSLDSSLY